MTSLHADVYALEALRQHRCGNIIMSAWHRLGYVTAQELADLKFQGDLSQLEEALAAAHVKGSMTALINLEQLPNLKLAEENRGMKNVAERAEAPGPGALKLAAPFPGPPAPKLKYV